MDLITNVKSQMTGWLGAGIPIPGLRKNEAASAEPEPAPIEPEPTEAKTEPRDDDDNSRYNRYEVDGSNESALVIHGVLFLVH